MSLALDYHGTPPPGHQSMLLTATEAVLSSTSLFQREELQVRGTKVKRVPELPDFYTNIKPAHFTNNSLPPPHPNGGCRDVVFQNDEIFLHLYFTR